MLREFLVEHLREHLTQVTEALDSVRNTRIWTKEAIEDRVLVDTPSFQLMWDITYPGAHIPCAEITRERLIRDLPELPEEFYLLKELENSEEHKNTKEQDESVQLSRAADGSAAENIKRSG